MCTDGGTEWPHTVTCQICLFFPREAEKKDSDTSTAVALTAMSRDTGGFREVGGQRSQGS